MGFIEQFFYGNIDPPSRKSIHPQAMKQVQNTLSQLEQTLCQQLQEPQRSLFLQYSDAWSDLNARSDLDSFVCGFRIGAQMALDTFVTDQEEH